MRRLGATCVSCLMAISGLSAMGVAGYMGMTGQSLCSMVSACGEKTNKETTEANVQTVANKETAEKKACCPLAKAAEAKVVDASAKEKSCSKTCTGAETVAAKSGSCAKSCSKGEAQVVNAAAGEGASCSKTCSGAKTVAAKSGGCSAAKAACGSVVAAKSSFVVLGASYPIVMPATFYKADASFCTASLKESGCNSPCTGEAKAVNAASKDASGCCKGTGVRADGKPCQNDGDHCKNKGEKKAVNEKGEPVASR